MPPPRRLSSVAALVGVAAVLAVPVALGQSLGERKEHIDARIAGLQEQIEAAKEEEGVLTSEISAASSKIEALTGEIATATGQLTALESELARHRERLERLQALYREQTQIFIRLRAEHQVAQERLEERLVAMYTSEPASTLDILLRVSSLGELIEQVDYITEIGRQDRAIADEVKALKIEMRIAREKTERTKSQVAEETAVLAEKTEEARAARAALVAQEQSLAAARSEKRGILAGVREHRHEAEEDLEAMLAASATLAARIRAAQSAPSTGGGGGGPPSASGFIWPVNGVLTSGFGWRWGRMHEGIDIAAPTGTAVRAAAAGTVIFSGWMGGYGNLVVLDHGGGLSTAYAHLSGIWASGSVAQGQGVGAVGSTGNSTGPHLHFEVRVNGNAVDPMGYL